MLAVVDGEGRRCCCCCCCRCCCCRDGDIDGFRVDANMEDEVSEAGFLFAEAMVVVVAAVRGIGTTEEGPK